MKKFKLFEHVVYLIQESLKDSTDTIIRKNVKIKDNKGRDNEFDVVVGALINNIRIRIVFECKDKGRPTERGEIDALAGKCLRISNINKKVFVSRSGYQAGAIEAAEEHSIDLFTLKEFEQQNIKDWFDPTSFQAVNHHRAIQNIHVLFKDESKAQDLKKSFARSWMVRVEKEALILNSKTYFTNYVRKTLQTSALIINDTGKPIPEERVLRLKLDEEISLKAGDQDEWHEVQFLELDILERIVPAEAKMITREYQQEGEIAGEITIVTALLEGEKSVSVVKKEDEIRVVEENPVDNEKRLTVYKIAKKKST